MTGDLLRPPPDRPRNGGFGRRVALGAAGAVPVLLAALVGGYVRRNLTDLEFGMAAVARAGFAEKRITVDGHTLAYAEGPDNGPPLVLVHGQGSRWQDHMRVLPALARDHRVFVVDVPGHGASGRLEPEQYTNAAVGGILAAFVAEAVGGPAILSGHSSGGLLALWIAAARPELVTALLLEDPPLFSSEMPRLTSTTGGTMLVLADQYLSAPAPGGFQRHLIEHGDYFGLFGPLAGPIEADALSWVDAHPGAPFARFYLPTEVTVFFQGLVHYDPWFGAAWVRDGGRWYAGFDTEAALRAVDVPTTLIHTNYFEARDGTAYDGDGTLMAAMDSDDVARALALLPAGTRLVQIRSGHLVHYERPASYLDALRELSARAG
ncbi:alpha/beta hydrolase [Pseudonocardia sp. C8]|uniref:alpha/beta hydrolase n=1 Tax=Pseudonocardia sp. C8 TaxID=2762759 RepID=UPI0016432A21|nr:alpha/beta hydrolase [Pseudonocardia sp. C8]MBC3191881.1 alpha/beta hydrolase [Pseudonocardia sp. C8]